MDLLKSDFFDKSFPEMSSMDKEFGTMSSTMSSMSSTSTMKSSSSSFDSSLLKGGSLGASDSLMGPGIGEGGSAMSSMSSTSTMKSSSSGFDSPMLKGSSLGASDSLMGAGIGEGGSTMSSMSSTSTMKSSSSGFDSPMLKGSSLGASDSLMGAGIGGGRLVPTTLFNWNFFDRQKSMFSDISMDFDNDFSKFDMELENMRKSMFRFDGDPMLKVDQPYVESRSGSKKLSLTFDVTGYKPENIHIKTVDSMLTVHAKHEEKSPGKCSYREFTKSYTLPKAVDPLALTSTLSADGVLSIEAPAPREVEAKKERFVAIELLKPL